VRRLDQRINCALHVHDCAICNGNSKHIRRELVLLQTEDPPCSTVPVIISSTKYFCLRGSSNCFEIRIDWLMSLQLQHDA